MAAQIKLEESNFFRKASVLHNQLPDARLQVRTDTHALCVGKRE